MTDLLLPRTDPGVLVQVAVVALATAIAVFALRRRPEWRLLAIGLCLFALGAMALRALH